MSNKILTRSIETERISIRSDAETGNRYIEFYAIVFNQRSKLIREWGEEFYEVIDPQSVDEVLSRDDLNVIATIDHRREKMLGRTKSKTLELIKDQKGILARLLVPDTSLGKDLVNMIERGDYYESSFIFSMSDYQEKKIDNATERTVLKIEKLYDVSIVIDGAYANTSVNLRSNEWEQQSSVNRSENNCDILQKQLEILKRK